MLFGINGFAGAGKDSLYHVVNENWAVGATRLAFADKLYAFSAAILGVEVEDLRAWKNDPDAVIRLFASDSQDWYRELNIRQFLQNVGTEGARENFGDSFWIDLVLDGITYGSVADPTSIIMVTDTRFPNEAQAIRQMGGYVVKVIGPPEVENRTDTHASEKPLPPELIDFYVDNSVRDDGYLNLTGQAVKLVNEVREIVLDKYALRS